MRICYVDEAGDTKSLPTAAYNDITPILVVAGLVIEQRLLENLTREFVEIKSKFYPGLVRKCSTQLERILPELKGADLRRAMRVGSRNDRRHTVGFLDALLDLLEGHDAKIFGRLWVKVPGTPCNDQPIYTFSVQQICANFENLLESVGDDGIVIADSRNPKPNTLVAHSVFTQKFSVRGDRYPRVLEMPLFGHSENHAGIQIADLLCSALLFPIGTYAYCHGRVQNVHVNEGFGGLRDRYGSRLQRMQHRYRDDRGRRKGGITVSDPLGCQPGGVLFRAPGSQSRLGRVLPSQAKPITG